MHENGYPGRGIHKEKFVQSLLIGNLSRMLEVINRDLDLDVQIRNDYLNIYYKGGNIARVKSEKSIEFDMFYYYLNDTSTPKKEIQENKEMVSSFKQKRDLLIKKFKAGDYENYFTEAKIVMNKWLQKSPKPERMEQHQLSIENQYNKSDYTIIDLEYEVSIRSDFACTYVPKGKSLAKKPRFDILAVNKQGTLCVIELKKGSNALKGSSGLKEHWDCYRYSIMQNHEPFMAEMKNVLAQKQAFKLIDSRVTIVNDIPEFMFAYSYDEKTSIQEQDEIFKTEYSKIDADIPIIKLAQGTFKLLGP